MLQHLGATTAAEASEINRNADWLIQAATGAAANRFC